MSKSSKSARKNTPKASSCDLKTRKQNHRKRSSTIETNLSLRISSQKFDLNKPSKEKEEFDIIDVSLTKLGKIEYIAQGRITGKKKYFTKKMILESKEMFSSLLSFYRFQVADFLKMNYNSIKKEKLCQDKTFCY